MNLLWEGVREGCGTCEFWLRHDGSQPFGSCKRYPPAMVSTTRKDPWGNLIFEVDQVLPTMAENDWCGEYQREATQCSQS